jgi:hypothetical protein
MLHLLVLALCAPVIQHTDSGIVVLPPVHGSAPYADWAVRELDISFRFDFCSTITGSGSQAAPQIKRLNGTLFKASLLATFP